MGRLFRGLCGSFVASGEAVFCFRVALICVVCMCTRSGCMVVCRVYVKTCGVARAFFFMLYLVVCYLPACHSLIVFVCFVLLTTFSLFFVSLLLGLFEVLWERGSSEGLESTMCCKSFCIDPADEGNDTGYLLFFPDDSTLAQVHASQAFFLSALLSVKKIDTSKTTRRIRTVLT